MKIQFSHSEATKLLLQGLFAIVIAAISFTAATLISFQEDQFGPVSRASIVDPQPNAPVTCDGKPMMSSDRCEHTLSINNGSLKSTFTYNEQKKYQSDSRIDSVKEKKDEANDQQKKTLSSIASAVGVIFLISFISGVVLLVKSFLAYRKVKTSASIIKSV